jgi:hypothetical protein
MSAYTYRMLLLQGYSLDSVWRGLGFLGFRG